MTKLLALALLTASATTSSAQVVAADGGYSREPTYKELDARVGMLIGGSDVGDADGFAIGVGGALGYRLGDVTLRGTADYYRVGDSAGEPMGRKGRATRLGGAVRYSFAHSTLDKSGFGGDFWGELGLGYEHVAWRAGGILDRPSGELAIGLDGTWRGDRDDRGNRKHVGYFMAFRSLVARGPEMAGAVATCGGPCSEATKPSRTDISMFFELGVHWGR